MRAMGSLLMTSLLLNVNLRFPFFSKTVKAYFPLSDMNIPVTSIGEF